MMHPTPLPLKAIVGERQRRHALTPTIVPRSRTPTPGGYFEGLNEGALVKRLLVEDRVFHDTLLKFAESEYSDETVLFFDSLLAFKTCETKDKALSKMNETFIKRGSKKEINISNSVRDQVERFLQVGESKSDDYLPLIELLEVSAMTSLLDIFHRFESSAMFNDLRAVKEVVELRKSIRVENKPF
jgi:hypothetical protein